VHCATKADYPDQQEFWKSRARYIEARDGVPPADRQPRGNLTAREIFSFLMVRTTVTSAEEADDALRALLPAYRGGPLENVRLLEIDGNHAFVAANQGDQWFLFLYWTS